MSLILFHSKIIPIISITDILISNYNNYLVIFVSATIFIFNINYSLINGFSGTLGLISFFFNSAFSYPGNDFTIILLLFNI